MPVLDFLHRRVFDALGMKSVFDCDSSALPSGAPTRYHRYGLGPARPAPKEGKGWLFAAGELAMTASDLAKWDVAYDRSDNPETAVLPRDGNSGVTQEWRKHSIRFGRGHKLGRNGSPALALMTEKSQGSQRRTQFIPTIVRRSSC